MTLRRMLTATAALVVAVSVAGCGSESWIGGNSKPPLPGKRLSVMSKDKELEPDTGGVKPAIMVPPPEPNEDWPQPGGYANHAMHHMQVGDSLKKVWRTGIGTGSGSRLKILAQPIIADGKVFAMDAEDQITALDAKTGRRIWSKDVTPEGADASSGGGLAYEDGRIFAATGFAQVVALDAKTGKVLWRQQVSGPMRGAPTVRAGRVFATTVDNQTHCLSAEDGQLLWSHQGIAETAALLAGNSPAVEGNIAIVPYSSGELFALRIENGATQWQDSLSTISRTQGLANLTDIRGRPIVDRGRVYAIGHADLMVAIDLRTGRRVWERQIGGIQSPWIAGDYLFLVTNNNEAVAIEAKSGRVLWVTQLQTWDDPEDKSGRIVWTGPVLASDRLVFGSSHGYLLSLSPYTGEVLGSEEVSAGITVPPAVAEGTMYVLTDGGDVVAYR